MCYYSILSVLTQAPPVPKNRKLENMNNNVKLAVDSARIAGIIDNKIMLYVC